MARIVPFRQKNNGGDQSAAALIELERALKAASSGTLSDATLAEAARNFFQFARLLLEIDEESSDAKGRRANTRAAEGDDA